MVITRIFLFLVVTTLLCQCTKSVNSSEPASLVPQKIINPYPIPTAEYLAQTPTEEGDAKQNSMLSSSRRLILDGQLHQAKAILSQTKDLTPIQEDEKKLLLAHIELMHDRNDAAMVHLKNITTPTSLSLEHQIQYHELLAQAYKNKKEYLVCVLERMELDHLLTDTDSKKINQRALWLALSDLSTTSLQKTSDASVDNSELQGWVQLALLSRSHRENPKLLFSALEQWQNRFSSHAAKQMLPDPLNSVISKILTPPKHIALLLPITGMLSGPGAAVYEGFMAGYKNSNPKDDIQIKLYDTNKGDVRRVYQQAVLDGAEYVVGPLTKTQVGQIAVIPHPVPTLLLNDSNAPLQNNSYLFGLSSSNEATQVAIKARGRGYHRVLIIAPQDWGTDIVKAFKTQWQKENGQITDTFLYTAQDDLNKKMQEVLHITASREREKKLKEVLGHHLETEVSRRQDFDVIFLIAYPSKARQIMPLLNYYYAGNVPVYATSSVYAGNSNALRDKDLDGIIFCDIPWVFSHQMGTRNWPEQFNSYNRLYALGMDSYALTSQLNQLLVFSADGSQEANGILYLKPSQQVTRVLEWGQFKQGLVHSLG